MTPILEVRGLKVHFHTTRGILQAVDGVSFPLNRGEILGLAGESGCGKTTTGLAVMRLLPDGGRIAGGQILYDGQDLIGLRPGQMRQFRWRHISMVFQGAMNALNPVRRVSEQIADAMVLHRVATPREAEKESARLLDLVGISPARGEDYPHEFSGGMRQRVMIAMALSCRPSVVIADEPTTALDVMIQAQIMALLKDLQAQLGLSMIVVSHDLAFLGELCNHVAIMYAGKLVEYGGVDQALHRPHHPYSKALLASIPRVRGPRGDLVSIPGDPPDLVAPPAGCLFRDRCTQATDRCASAEPPALPIEPGHLAACHLYGPESGPHPAEPRGGHGGAGLHRKEAETGA